MDILSRLDLFEIGRRYILARATKIEPSIVDTRGSDANIFVGSMSFVGVAIVRQAVKLAKARMLDGANGEDLVRLVFDRYQLPPKEASPAVGSVSFVRSVFTAGGGTIPIGTKLRTLTGIEYITLTDAVFGITQLTATADVRSVQAGKSQQVGKNQIRRFAEPGSIFDPSIQVTNPLAMAGGEDAEQDPAFRERARDFWPTQRRGTLGAIEFGAKTVAGVDSAAAYEALTANAQPARVVSMYIADSSGIASAALGAAVRAQLNEYRAAGIAVITELSIPQMITVKLKLAFVAGVDTATIGQAVRTAIVGVVNSLGANQTLLRATLTNVLTRYVKQGLIPDDSTIVEPVGDLVPTPGSTLRTTFTLVTIV